MVKFVVVLMFCTLIIDITIGFIWIGLIGFRELMTTYEEVFPNSHAFDWTRREHADKKK